jgi:hypothetical protein
MLSATDPDKLSVLMPEPIRWYGVLVLQADPTGVFVAQNSGDRVRDATIGSNRLEQLSKVGHGRWP